MKKALLTLIITCLYGYTPAQIWSLPADQEDNIKDICAQSAGRQFAIDVNLAEKDLAMIYNKLGFSNYQIEVISCSQLHNSALAYMDPVEQHAYILVNPNKLTDLNEHYYAHAFIIAHEFAHIALKHFSAHSLPTNSNKQLLELGADEYAASLISQLGGTENDCILALNSLQHPDDDTYSDHPTLVRRLAAVKKGFNAESKNPLPEPVHAAYVNKLPGITTGALLQYNSELNPYDITSYSEKQGMYPRSIMKLDDKYWVYWEKDAGCRHYAIWWNYDQYPSDTIQYYFDKNYVIKFIEKINDRWFLVMTESNESPAQKTRSIMKATFREDIETYLNDGFSIQNITSWNAEKYLVLLTKNTDSEGYSWAFRSNYDDFKTWYEHQANSYNYMYCFKQVDNLYFGFMTNKKGVLNWAINAYRESDNGGVINYMNSGYRVENVTFDGNIRFTLVRY